MDIYIEPPIDKAPTWVISDDSSFAQNVADKLQQLGLNHLKFVSLKNSNAAAVRPPIVWLISAANLVDIRVAEQLASDSATGLLITEAQAKTETWQPFANKVVNDVLLWPEPLGLVRMRIELLRRLYEVDSQVDAMRRSLAWHKARVEREHQLVEHIFQNALSRNYLDYEFVRTYLTPVSKFNGDLCLISPGPLGNIYMLMADFTGHGLAPATGALPLSQAFFAMADRGVSVAEMVTEFNYRMNRLLPNDMFCAAILLELSANGERVTYWNGGMPPALLFNDAGEILKRLNPSHMALGVVDDEEFDSRVTTFRAPKDSSIALFTDGVTELLGHQHQFLGSEALEVLLSKHPKADEFPKIVEALEGFRGETPLHDDLSLAILQCHPTGLGAVQPEADIYGLPFEMKVELTPEHLKTVDPVSHILAALSQLPFLRRHRTTIYLFLAEAFNNALEHGLLGLDSSLKQDVEGFAQYYQLRHERLAELNQGQITIRIAFATEQRQLQVSVADSGHGFAATTNKHDLTKSYGRGLDLLRQMTSDLRWDQTNREVSFNYRL
ncbi:MAG: SpoIIE family protein phosphatase [Gammaproteobacteria bacterium]|jgi:serine phosphatase RsbU (regulator of sigma subunit)|nr:SpoIIE family protein phosphatase [Gammaproteobacteria bacterium]